MRIPEHIIDQVRTQADIVAIIGEHVPLKKSSRNYVGLCPFHKEKSPSFNVNPDRGIYKCFGCGKAGNVITFVEQHLHMGFVDAVKHLAQRTGIVIPDEEIDDPTGEHARRDSAMRALRDVSEYYQEVLESSDGKTARDYYSTRGFSQDIIESFSLGAAPASWDATMNHLLGRGFTIEHLVDAGLVITRDDGKTYDRFRGRAMFAICDDGGRVVGFSARTLTNEPGSPKYVNSPQSIVFDKSRVLFGLHKAKRSIIEHRTAILVEGQADVITLHQAGFTSTVASSGTALTADHVRLIKRLAEKLVLVFDSDEAGQQAMSRGIELALAGGLEVYCVVLPPGTDPDSFVLSQGAVQFQSLLDSAQWWLSYQTNRLQNQGALSSPLGQAKAVRSMLEWIATVPDTLRHPFLIRDLAERFRLDEKILSNEFHQISRGVSLKDRSSTTTTVEPARKQVETAPQESVPIAVLLPSERELIKTALLSNEGLALLINVFGVTAEFFWSASGRRIYSRILYAHEEFSEILHHVLDDDELTADERRELADIAFTAATPSEAWLRFNVEMPSIEITRPIRDALLGIEIHRVHRRIDELTKMIGSTADLDERKRHVYRINKLIGRREELLRQRLHDDPKDLAWLRADSVL